MTVQRSRGKARPAPARADELPRGVAAAAPDQAGPVARDRSGRITSSEAARELGRRGGRAKAEKDVTKWARTLGVGAVLEKLGADANVKPYVDESDRWYRERAAEVASVVGGGVASAGVCSVLRTAAMQRAFSAFFFELGMTGAFAWNRSEGGKPTIDPRTDLVLVASRLGDASRQNLLAAHELAAKEAASRPKPNAYPWAALPAPSTSTTSTAARNDDADEALTVPAETAPPSADDGLQRADLEEDDKQAEPRTASPTAVVVPSEPAQSPQGPAWLPPCLSPFHALFEDLAALHPMGRHGAIKPRAEALARQGRLGNLTAQGAPDEVAGTRTLHAVTAWMAQHPLPPEMS